MLEIPSEGGLDHVMTGVNYVLDIFNSIPSPTDILIGIIAGGGIVGLCLYAYLNRRR